jgi:serine phosphatase RsbU (regulator of sigma subunit)/PAS domain-containing protein
MTDQLRDIEHAAMRALASASTGEEATPALLEDICRALDWSVAAFWIVDEPSNVRLTLQALYRRANSDLDPFIEACRDRTFEKATGLPGRVWATSEPQWVADVVHDLNFPRADAAEKADLHGGLAIPITAGDQFLGVIEFFSTEIREPDPELLDTMAAIGKQLGRFLERERLARRLGFHAAVLEAQGESAIDGILVVSPDDKILYWNSRFLEIWEVPEDLVRAGDRHPVIERKARLAADPEQFKRNARAVFDDPDTSRREEIPLADGRVVDRWTAPVRAPSGTLLGRVLYYRDVTQQKLAEKQLRENERWSAFLAEVTTVMSQTLDYRSNLSLLARMVVPILADWCVIHVLEEGELRLVAMEHEDASKLSLARRMELLFPVDLTDETGAAAVVRAAASLLFEDITDDLLETAARDPEHLEQLRSFGLRSAMVVPLIGRDRVLGTLTLVSAESGRHYTKEELRLAEDLAARVAFPIDNARLYEERARVAQTLQKSLLPPQLPDIAGAEIAARYHPVAEGAEVGGDFYDVFAAGPRSWGLVLGDVSGKGVEAATVTSLARHTLRTATMATQQPSQILSMLNAALLEQTEPDAFCTAVYALIEPRFGRVNLTVSCGGHPLPYVVRSNGVLEPLACEGTLLGVVADPELHDVSVELDFGDKLIVYTDGIFDVGPRDAPFEPHDIEKLFAACAKRGVNAAADLIEKAVLERQQGQARDDFALVIFGVRSSIFRRARSPRLWRRMDGDEQSPGNSRD